MSTISTIPNFTNPPPATSDPDNFDIRADSAFSDLYSSIIPGLNASIGEMNTFALTIDNLNYFASTGYPDQTDKEGQFLSTDGSLPKWVSLNQAIGHINNPLLHMPMNNSLVMNKGVGSATFSRNTTATYIDRYGVLKTAAIDEPRFEKEGALFEGTSTNLALYSQDFSNSVWLKGDVTASYNSIVAPDGTTTATRFTGTSGDPRIFQEIIGVSTTDTYTYSIWMKTDVNRNIGITLGDYGIAPVAQEDFYVTTQWQKFQVTGSNITSSQAEIFIGGFGLLSDGEVVDVWGAQIEKLPFAASYIPTTSAPVTRGCDLLQIPIIGNSPYYLKNNDMSIMFDIKIYSPTDNSGLIIIYYDDPDDPHLTTLLRAYVLSSNRVLWQYAYSNEGDAAGQINMVIDGDNTFRIAKVIKDGFCTTYTNGKIINVSSEAAYYSTDHIPTSADFINIGRAGYTAFFHISNLRIYDRALTEQEMEIA